MPTFRVQGQVQHLHGSLLPLPNEQPKFLQIYFVGDYQAQAEQRCAISSNDKTELDLILKLQEMLHQCNPYVKDFKYVLEQENLGPDCKVVIDSKQKPSGSHRGRYNEPTCSEVAVIIAGEAQADNRDIVLETRSAQLKRITETHRSYDALQYPLLLPWGDDGYRLDFKPDPNKKKVTCMDFYSYLLMVRDPISHLHLGRALFSQYIVDMYAKMDAERCLYVRLHQKELRADKYVHLRDDINNDRMRGHHCQQRPKCHQCENAEKGGKGQLVILPSSFTGSPRYMHERTQDGMKYVQTYGRPDFFITFTCNPNWKEIKDNLAPGQTPQDRHDIVARVFHLKVNKLMDLIDKSGIYGPRQAWMYSIEWQKRGLPHAHILLWTKKKVHANDIDKVISAEIPNKEEDPKLFDIVTKHMVHGPCGVQNRNSPCMEDGKCGKRYPRPYTAETQTGEDGYPAYRRRKPEDGGQEYTVKMKNGHERKINNQWIVPYSPLLCKAFDAHINVEWCNSVKSIKYVCKYVNKGSDAAMFALMKESTNDEVSQYQDSRYISTNEGVWNILGFKVHRRYPPVHQLSVHLENGQRVYYTAETAAEVAENPKDSTLMGFFKLCQTDNFAKTLLYDQVPGYYTWQGNKWNRRLKGEDVTEFPGIKKTDDLGRVYTIHPNQQECFFLRMLLHEVRGPTSFQALKTVDGEVCGTFREACKKRGLLEDDAQWEATLQEAAVCKTPEQMRTLFAIMLHHCCELADPLRLWTLFQEDLCEDFLHRARRQALDMTLGYTDHMFNQGLIALEDKVMNMGGKALQDYGLPVPDRTAGTDTEPREVLREKNYDIEALCKITTDGEPKLLPEQLTAYQTFLKAVQRGSGGLFFLDAPGGTGKTFVTNLLLAKVRQQGKIALAVASSGIAAYLLPNGRTAHTTFKLPLDLTTKETPTCNIGKGSGPAELLKQCSLIVWDECTMSHKAALEAVDRTLRDIRGITALMGNVPVILSGDFRQILPVVRKGTSADELRACLKSSRLWRHVKTLRLTVNMRAQLSGDACSAQFAHNLLKLGEGKVAQDEAGLIDLSTFANVVSNEDELIEKVFPNFETRYKDTKWLSERAILAPKNVTVNSINDKLLTRMPSPETKYKSVDTVMDKSEAVEYPVEFLNSLEPPNVPPHNLKLKVGATIMLLRNLDAPKLVNGTRLVVKRLNPHVIEATILCGTAKGEDVFIPRIPLIPNDLPFDFKRLQFPVRPCSAMSINKSQGKTS